MSQIKIAIIGPGAIARVQIEALKSFEDCKIVAICGRSEERIDSVIKDYELKDVKKFISIDDLMLYKEIDCVSICLPPSLHCEVTLKALNAGFHVIVEKPMAMSVAECDEMINVAKENNKLLSVICQNRFKNAYQKLKIMLDEKALGKINHIKVDSLWWRGENYYDLAWRGTWKTEGGGCLLSHGVHQLDLLLWLIGRPDKVIASFNNLAHSNSECEDMVNATLLYNDKKQANVTVSLVHHGESQEIVIQGEKGRISAPFKVSANKALDNGYPYEAQDEIKALTDKYESLPNLPYDGHKAQLREFIDAIAGKNKLTTSGEDARNVMELAMAIYKAAVTHEVVTLPLSKDDPFYEHESRVKLMPHFNEKKKSVEIFKNTKISLGKDVDK